MATEDNETAKKVKMAKFVIAGRADCPFYAKAELLGDELQLNLPEFKIHKIVKRPEEWEDWLKSTCEERGWTHRHSPLIWRELVDRGGKGILLGGCDDFMEFADGYYGITSHEMSAKLVNMAQENLDTKIEVDKEEDEIRKQINPLRVCVEGASSSLAYGMLAYLTQGEIFGLDQEVFTTLLDLEETQEALQGISWEIQDCAWPLYRGTQNTSDPSVAFKNANVVVFIDEAPIPDDSKREYILSKAKLFRDYGKALEEHANKDCKVLIVGGPSSITALVASNFAPSIPKKNFAAVSRIAENRAKGLLAKRLNVNTAGIKDVIVWGGPGFNQHADASNARVDGYDGAIWGPHIPGFTRSVPEMVHDDKWLAGEFLETLKKPYEGQGSLMSSAAVLMQLQDWFQGTSSEVFSLGVISEGQYDVPEGIVFSFPVKFSEGSWQVEERLAVSETTKETIKTMAQEIKTQSDEVIAALSE